MADTKKTYTVADEEAAKVDEQGILDRFNAATTAQFNLQREQNRQAENAYYNQMYNTQKTAMDTIRQNNAAAVATGASRGVQAANELSAILGLQQESVAGATEVAQARRQTAQEETAAVLENVLKAYQQAETERQNRRTAVIEGASVDATNRQTDVTELGQLMQAYALAEADQDTALMQTYAARMQELGYTPPKKTEKPENTDQPNGIFAGKPETAEYTNGIVTKSGINANGDLVFNPNDLKADTEDATAKSHIYTALSDAGIDYDETAIIDLNDSSTWDKIKQNDLDSQKQSGEAYNYIKAIQSAIENKDSGLKPGMRVVLNYGKVDGSNYEAIYLGNGKFAWVKPTFKSSGDSTNMFIPEGYNIKLEEPDYTFIDILRNNHDKPGMYTITKN